MRATSGNSIFTYSLSRQYPSRAITWIVLVGGVCLTVLFSFVAAASNAYQFQSIYTTDPNATVSDKHWFQKAPFSWLNAMDTKCQAALLTAGSQYLTTNRGFVYTLERLAQVEANGSSEAISSAAYSNVTLERCEVAEIKISLARSDNSRLPHNFWAWSASSASATTTCSMHSESEQLSLNFTTVLSSVGSRSKIVENFLTQNTSANANMYYGIQLLDSWYGKLSYAMGYSAPGGEEGSSSWGYGEILLTRTLNVSDYHDPAFFLCNIGISNDQAGLSFMHFPHTIKDWHDQWTTTVEGDRFQLPNISITVDTLGKTFYSLLLSDFGVGNKSINALASSDGIQYLQSVNDTYLSAAAYAFDPDRLGSTQGLVTEYYDPNEDPLENLNETTPTTLFTQYLCSVPRQKGGFSIFFGILLADIVFLSACWTVFGWVATWWFSRNDPHLDYCAGCAAALARDDVALVERESTGARAAMSPAMSGDYLPVAGEVSQDRISVRSTQPLIRHHSDISQ